MEKDSSGQSKTLILYSESLPSRFRRDPPLSTASLLPPFLLDPSYQQGSPNYYLKMRQKKRITPLQLSLPSPSQAVLYTYI